MGGVFAVPFRIGKRGSIDCKHFNTEEERGPRRATEKQNLALRAIGVGIGVVVRRLLVGSGFCSVFGRGAGRAAELRFSVVLGGPRSSSVLKFVWCQWHSPRRLRSNWFAWPLVAAGETERGRNKR
jgi:hypothetical protein